MAILGNCGAVSIILPTGETWIGEAYEWSLELAADAVDSPSFNCNGFSSTIPGLKSGSGSISARWDINDIGQRAMHDTFYDGMAVDIRLYTNLSKTQYYQANVSLNTYAVENPVDDIVDLSFDYSTNGTVNLISTMPVFLTAPTVVYTDANDIVTFTFTQPLNTKTISTSTFFVRKDDATEAYFPASISISPDFKIITLTMLDPLPAGNYVAITTTEVKSQAGASLSQTNFFDFVAV